MSEEEINLRDLEEKVKKKNKYLTDFLSPLEVKKIKEYFMQKKLDDVTVNIYEADNVELERTRVYLVMNDYLYDTINYECLEDTYDLSIIKITPSKFSKKLFHKDFLGSILGLGIKRDKVGDIITCDDNSAYVFIANDILDFIKLNLTKIGHETIKVDNVNKVKIENKENDFKERDLTITSYRMDNLIAHAFGVSRTLAQSLIEKEFVKVNYETNINDLYEIKEGDLLSVRGYGRIKIALLDGENKKGRKRVKVQIYSKDKK